MKYYSEDTVKELINLTNHNADNPSDTILIDLNDYPSIDINDSVDESYYKDKYDWVTRNLKDGLKSGLLTIATELSIIIHCRKYMTEDDIIKILCAIRNSIWDMD